ncbi:hypothetical protein AVEN_209333-1 [Araneus ventricosus]|uniref:Ig-like domain-containing protein n=1 Tax=Araneus ventricosus TaxID=182803 RepID=A0A4Y2CAW8_ARAVE|nr:hypothetical protein AVEN_209333-1 [Araneus ventricosus]
MRIETQTILTMHRHVISRNYRIALSHSEHRVYVLHINDVQEEDRGSYMCQVNTVPMLWQIGYLDVVVPPDIIEEQSSSDMFAREGTDIQLKCAAKGRPEPKLTWRREDYKPVGVGNWQKNNLAQKETNRNIPAIVAVEGKFLDRDRFTWYERVKDLPDIAESPLFVSLIQQHGINNKDAPKASAQAQLSATWCGGRRSSPKRLTPSGALEEFVDDFVFLVNAETKQEVETLTNKALQTFKTWTTSTNLKFHWTKQMIYI